MSHRSRESRLLIDSINEGGNFNLGRVLTRT